jgi:diacylglycerol kinase (ATP)
MANKKLKVIVSTRGGRLGSQAKIALVEEAMQAANLDYQLEPTDHPNHGFELARQAALDGWPIVVAAGGDGTIGEVVNGLMQAAGEDTPSTLGILPLGTGNDLADMLQLPRDITAACRRIAAGNTRLIDLGMVNGHYFANNSAVGLEPMVSIEHEKMRLVSGNIRYILAALKAIAKAKPWNMRIAWDNGIYEGPITLVSVGNSPRTGGTFYMTPEAKLDDGLLDFVYAIGMSRWRLLTILPQTFSGKHIHHPLVTCLKTKSLSITVSPVTPIQADGELIDKTASEVNYHIIPQTLHVIV